MNKPLPREIVIDNIISKPQKMVNDFLRIISTIFFLALSPLSLWSHNVSDNGAISTFSRSTGTISWPLTPYNNSTGSGQAFSTTQDYVFTGPFPNAVNDAVFTIRLSGDINNNSSEYVTLRDENNQALTGRLFSASGNVTRTLTIDANTFNNWAADGQIVLTVVGPPASATNVNSGEASMSLSLDIDDQAPTVVVQQNVTVQLDANGNGSLSTAQVDGGSSDAGGIQSRVLDRTSFDCSDVLGNSLNFDGNNDNVRLSTPINIGQGNSTVEAWVKVPKIGEGGLGSSERVGIILGNFSSSNNINYEIHARGQVRFWWNNGQANLYGTKDLRDGKWHHVAFVRIASQNRFIAYIDGEEEFNIVRATSQVTFSSTHRIGGDNRSNPPNFHGNIDELRIWNFARSQAQIQADMLDALTGSEDGLLNYWNFEEGSGSTLTDLAGGNTGTLNLMDPANDWVDGAPNNAIIPVTLTVTDNSGNAASETAMVRVKDAIAPTIAPSASINVALNASGVATISEADLQSVISDNCEIACVEISQTSFNCSNLGANMITVTLVDNSNNTTTGQINVIVQDNIAPVVNGQNTTVTLTAAGTASITPQEVLMSGTDNCGPIAYTLSQGIFGTQDAVNSPVTVRLIGTDPSGNATPVDVQVTVIDPVPLVITQNITVALDANGNATITPEQIDNGSSAIVGLSSLSLDITEFDCSNVGTPVTVTLTATSTLGSTATETATVTVIDQTAPTVITQNVVIDLSNGSARVTPEQVNNGSNDACGIASVSLDREFFNCADIGDQTVTLTVTDVNGNSQTANATVTVRDVTPPHLNVINRTFGLDNNGQLTIVPRTMHNSSNDECGGPVVVTIDKDTFDCTNLGENIITVTSTDESGNQNIQQAILTIVDAAEPEIRVRDYLLVELDENGEASISFEDIDLGTRDNCGLDRVEVSRTSYTCSDLGALVITSRAFDVNGNLSNLKETLIEVRDAIAPQAIAQNISVDLDANGIARITPEQINNGSTDNCSISSFDLDRDVFSCGDIGENTVTLTVFDAGGNFSTATATVTVNDITPPSINVLNRTFGLDENGRLSLTPRFFYNSLNDECGGEVTVTTDVSEWDCTNLGENIVRVTATDARGNSITVNSILTIVDSEGPTPVAKEVITVQLDENGLATITPEDVDNGTFDNCGVASLQIDRNTFSCADVGGVVVNLTATDVNGNVSVNRAQTVVIVEDRTVPVVITQNITVDLDAGGTATIAPEQIDNGSSDVCGVVSLELDRATFGCDLIGENEVTLTVRDASGNFNTGTAIVTVRDITPPTINVLNRTFGLDGEGKLSLTPSFFYNSLQDQCGGEVIVTTDVSEWDCTNLGENIVNVTATDQNGNSVTEQAILTIVDAAEPTPVAKEVITIQLDENGVATITPEDVDNGTFDNCGVASLHLDRTTFSCADVGSLVVNLTATDINGNASVNRAQTIVIVEDTAGPVITANDTEVFLDTFGNASISLSDLGATANDPCGSGAITIDKISFDCSNLGANTVTLTATDTNGNTSTRTVTVTVTDNIAPTVGAQNISLELDANGNASITPEDVLILDASDVVTGEDCTVSAAEEHAVWLSNYVQSTNTEASHRWGWGWRWKPRNKVKSKNTRFVFTAGGGNLHKNEDGTATVTGTIVSTTDATDSWTITLNLKDARNWQEWSALGRSYKDEKGLAGDKYLDWAYYEMGEASQLTGTGRNQGDVVMLSHAPSDYRYGFQVGEAANSKNANFGMSGWFFYKNRAGKWVQGDFNLDVTDCNPSLPPTGTVVTSDNCSLDSFTLSQSNFDCSDLGDNIVNVTVTDQSGNATTVPVTVTINDPTGPTAVAKDITVSLGADGTVTITPQDVDGGSTDNCGIVSYSLSRDTFDCGDVTDRRWGYYKRHKRGKKVTLTVTDAAGNTDSAVAYVTVVDDQAPEISSDPITVVVYGRRSVPLNSRDVYPAVTDNCGVRYISFSRKRFTRRDVGLNSVWVSAVDYSGNRTTGMLNVNVVDISAHGRWVEICYNGRSWRVNRSHVQHWLRKGASLGNCSSSMISQASEFTYGEEESTTKESDILELDIRPEVKLSTYPNPTSGYTVISFMSEVEGSARVAVMNTSGVQLATLFDEEVGAGEEVEVGYETNKLTSGIYLIRLVTPAGIKTVKLLVRK